MCIHDCYAMQPVIALETCRAGQVVLQCWVFELEPMFFEQLLKRETFAFGILAALSISDVSNTKITSTSFILYIHHIN